MEDTLKQLGDEVAALRKDMNALLKLVRKVRAHQEDPTGEKTKERSANNGFNRPMAVSPELREFLGLAEGETISRSNVTRKLTAYVKENGLKHPDNGRILILDEKLTKLLKPPEGVQVTFLNVQKYLSPHYTKIEGDAPAEASTSAPAPAPAVPSTPAKPKAARPTVKKAATVKA